MAAKFLRRMDEPLTFPFAPLRVRATLSPLRGARALDTLAASALLPARRGEEPALSERSGVEGCREAADEGVSGEFGQYWVLNPSADAKRPPSAADGLRTRPT